MRCADFRDYAMEEPAGRGFVNADYRAAHRVIVDAAAQAQRVTDYFRNRRLAL